MNGYVATCARMNHAFANSSSGFVRRPIWRDRQSDGEVEALAAGSEPAEPIGIDIVADPGRLAVLNLSSPGTPSYIQLAGENPSGLAVFPGCTEAIVGSAAVVAPSSSSRS